MSKNTLATQYAGPRIRGISAALFREIYPSRTPLKIETRDSRIIVEMPEEQPEGPSWAVVLKVDGEPRCLVQ